MTKKGSQHNKSRISIESDNPVDLYKTLCSTSDSKEACRRFVDRLEEASNNIRTRGS